MMAASCSLQFPYELGICKRHRQSIKLKRLVEKGRLYSLSSPLSSQALRTDTWSLHLLNQIRRPIHVSPKYGILTCRSFFMPGRGEEIPIYKAAILALSRSCNALSRSPILLQLAPAVGVIAFSLWGLGPVACIVRRIFFHRNDNSWRKSRTNYVLTSYLQPLLLWTGATLVCRVLDPVTLPTEASQAVKQRLVNFVRSLSTVLAFAYCFSSLIQQTQKFFMETNDLDDARNMGFQFAGKAVYTAVWVAAVSLFMELLGFSTQKWLTAGGLGTVLLTLAGREIFTNFLSSVMIHATRPFVLNEWIQTKIEGYEVSGTVEHVGWWSPTIIRGDDREAVHIPNHKFTVNVVRNLSQKTHWRIKTHLAISHLDVNKINNIVADMRKVLAKNPQVEQQRLHRRVFLENIDPENQALLILVSCFVKTSHFEEYLCVKEAILLDLLRVISHHRARLATPIRTVQKIYGDADIENIPFSETIISRAGVNNSRPFLLIEPSSRSNADERAKARSTRTSEENDVKSQNPEAKSALSEGGAQGGSENKQGNKKARDQGKVDATPGTNIPSTSTASQSVKAGTGAPDSMALNSKDSTRVAEKPVATVSDNSGDKMDGSTTSISHAKLEGEKGAASPPTARSALQDNIVLGVALDGSKRTLPIEDEVKENELAALRNGNNSPAGKDGQFPAVPGAAASGDPREQDR
ncbi:Mechanosensitive ion channel protein 2 [Nymphaea thermarum]|nr:Mechanosensitive ion channel protein 2 [Nymphaea thermarum]